MTRGRLRIYLGCAPGVGKTFAMLDEGHRRASRGTDVVVAYVETHGRPHTADKLGGLPVVARRRVVYRDTELPEMDLPGVLARRPEVALVDELAHTNVPGLEHDKRWQDVEALLEAGIDVVSTMNVQHLESLNDVVEAITGVAQRETVPDAVVRAAEQVELVDMTPEALRRRMAHGNIYTPDKVDAALSNYFRPGNLTALRELALLWLADSVEEGLRRYRDQHGIAATWETRERVVVALTGGPEGETLIRRAARIAARTGTGDLLAVHVTRGDGLAGSSIALLEKQRLLVESLGGSYHSVVGDSIPTAVIDFARANNATQIVIGASRRNPILASLTGPGTGMSITRVSGSIDVHVISHDYIGKGRALPHLTGGLTTRRRLTGLLVAAVLLAVLTPLCAAARSELGFGSDLLLYLLVVVAASLIGGFYAAFVTAVTASLLLNYYFVTPIHTFTINQPENIFALVAFVVIASAISRVVDRAARRTSEAARSNAEAETLAALAGSVLRGDEALPALLGRVRETFSVGSVTLMHRDTSAPTSHSLQSAPVPDGQLTTPARTSGLRGTWTCLASVGDDPSLRPEDGDAEVPVGDNLKLVLRGRTLPASDQRLLTAFAAQVAVAYEQRRLAAAAAAAIPLAEADRMRTALLNAVSHDLRTPIASAKAAVSGLRGTDVTWSENDRQELLAHADGALDRLTDLVTNLLDLSRVQAGVLRVNADTVGLDDVISRALDHTLAAPLAARTLASLGDATENGAAVADTSAGVVVDISPDLPAVQVDAGLLERVIANLVDNALRYTPATQPVRVAASSHGRWVELRVIDRGPGIPVAAREAVFEPFQRRDDHATSRGAGVGLGLAIARSFAAAMRGRLTLEDTPGGGLTAVIALPIGPDDPAVDPTDESARFSSPTVATASSRQVPQP